MRADGQPRMMGASMQLSGAAALPPKSWGLPSKAVTVSALLDALSFA